MVLRELLGDTSFAGPLARCLARERVRCRWCFAARLLADVLGCTRHVRSFARCDCEIEPTHIEELPGIERVATRDVPERSRKLAHHGDDGLHPHLVLAGAVGL